MDATPNIAFTPGTAVILTTIENGFPAIRHVEFLSHVDGGPLARVKFGLETFNVQLDQLSRIEPPQPPAFLGKWFEAPKPPPIPSDADIQARLTERRQVLAQAHTRAKLAQDQVTASRSISQRADRGVAEAKATLATLDAADRAQQRQLEDALAAGKPLPQRSNGHDRGYLLDRLHAAEQAQQRFAKELGDATTALSNSLSAIRRAAAAVIAGLLERETENLRAAEQRAALLRAELNSVAGWWPSAEIGVLKISPASAPCIAEPVAWRDQPAVRQGTGWLKPWQSVFDRLCQGDVESDFALIVEE